MSQLIELNGVSKIYNGERGHAALDSVSLDIHAGEVTAVMGPSGSGKSTLLNVIGGLDRPTKGTVLVDGADLGRLSEAGLARFRRTTVGIIFQFFNLLNNLTALDNVTIPAQLAGIKPSQTRRRALELLERLGIASLRDQYPARLSGGERQRVAIARALINNPVLLLADEPTGALDSQSGDQVMAILSDLNRSGQTLVLVTHDERLARSAATRVVRLIDGAILDDRRDAAHGLVQVQ
ncbi:MAG TPA: ABC transporter ATP-binding protein [Candidatus Dormibacteraeota bacterium]|nr:ABC transporter ATP-binding protein [Candidatus Dormibacteraeota bacterium]